MRVQHRAEQRSVLAALAALTASTTFFTLLSWSALTEWSSQFLLPLFFVCVVTAGIGFACRALGVPRLLLPVVEVGVGALAINRLLAAGDSVGGWVPTVASLRLVNERLVSAMATSQQYAAPIPRAVTETFSPLLIVAGVGVIVLVDLCVFTLRRVPVAGLPLLAAFTAPVSLLGGVPWVVFSCAAVSFVLLLAVDQTARLARWGRGLGAGEVATPVAGRPVGSSTVRSPTGPVVADRQPRDIRLGMVWPTASRLALTGVGLAVVAPVVLPSGSGLFHPGTGGTFGGGNGDVSITNPLLDIRRNLSQGDDVDLVTLRREGSVAPTYLRLTVLDQFDGQTWRPSERAIPREQVADGKLAPPPGLNGKTPADQIAMHVSVLQGFQSTWLPTPYPAASVTVDGDWRYDLRTMDILSADEDVTAAGLSYDTVGLDLHPRVRQLVDATSPPAAVYSEGTDLPDAMPGFVRARALQVTKGADSQFEEAVRLQDWFRRSGGFTYSLEHAEGSGLDQLELFLGTGAGSRTGYCEQFAAAMTLMARALGIPARIAVGFLRPQPAADGSWTYSTHDLHSWPELYFEGAGWIRFEPTPQDRTRAAPEYTAGTIPAPQDSGNVAPESRPTLPDRRTAPDQELGNPAANPAATDEGSAHRGWFLATAVAVGFAGLSVTPRLLRRRVRRRRLAGPPAGAGPAAEQLAESAWTEVRATALDLGRGWDDTETLRRRARSLTAVIPRRPALLSALESVVLTLERARYAPTALSVGEATAVRQHSIDLCQALEEAASPRARRRARWLPASLWRGRRLQLRGVQGPGSGADRGRSADQVEPGTRDPGAGASGAGASGDSSDLVSV